MTQPDKPALTTVYHLGGHGGLHRSFENWWLPLRYVAFEAEPAEADTLRRAETPSTFEVVGVAIGDRAGSRPFYIYALSSEDLASSSELSSLLRFAPERSHRYRDADVRLVETASIDVATIDSVASQRGDRPTFIVADVQGAELIALEGATEALRETVLGLRLEVSFIPLYEGQPLFGDVDAAMRARGFSLSRIERCGSPTFGPSTDAGPFSVTLEDARPSWADAVYVRDTPVPAAGGRWRGVDLANLICFALENGIGSVGLDLLFDVLENGYLEEALDELDPATRAVVIGKALDHLERSDTAAVTSGDPVRRELDAGRRSSLRQALAG